MQLIIIILLLISLTIAIAKAADYYVRTLTISYFIVDKFRPITDEEAKRYKEIVIKNLSNDIVNFFLKK